MRALIIGCGYLGRRVAAIWRSKGINVGALTRTPENASLLAGQGIEPIVGDVLRPESLRTLPAADIALYAVGFDRQGGTSKRDVYVDGLANCLKELAPRVERILYVSSTSVYGQDAGEWIDETSETRPVTEDGQIVLAAESNVRELCPEGTATILRFSGLYGPDRLLRRIESVRRADPIAANPDGFLNLIHADDGATIVSKLAERTERQPVYLVTDDRPVHRREYYSLLAKLVSAPEPTFNFAPSASAGSGLNKRCSNVRLKAELGNVLRFPTIESGLPHAVGK
jgi:nucleoside-diphosphate-sugar epimerase